MTNSPNKTSEASKAGNVKPVDANAPKAHQAKPKPARDLPLTKAERAQRMRIDKTVIKRMRKR
ncbi:MAG: hypothetical protein J0I19_06000 [Alphaproteobacteria bacterium]|nr:hypothetical protein [Alphaproteobacteria bacterium]